MKVKDLIELLQGMDQNLPVGRLGYFGEFYAMDPYQFSLGLVTSDRWPHDKPIGTFVLHVSAPDIGEEPD
jgi:hypothetical protein